MKPRILVVAALGAFVLGACESPKGSQNTYVGGEATTEITSVEKNGLLRDSLVIVDVRTRRLADDRMQTQFELHNKTRRNLDFAWAVLWFDSDGFQVSDGTHHWQPVTLGGNGMKTLTITAPSPAASAWQLEITTPNEID